MSIIHSVIFTLKYDKGDARATQFLSDGKRLLSAIPGVEKFQVFDQVSVKNPHQFGFSMIFADMDVYAAYNIHPDHVAFVENRWKTEVSDFLEIDYTDWGNPHE